MLFGDVFTPSGSHNDQSRTFRQYFVELEYFPLGLMTCFLLSIPSETNKTQSFRLETWKKIIVVDEKFSAVKT